MHESDNTFGFQLYGDGSHYGFLDGNWGGWDVRKQINGPLQIRIDTGSTDHTVWCAGNDGSGSGLDADTVDGVQASSFLRSDATDVYNCNGNALQFDFDNAGRNSISFTLNGSTRWQFVHDNSGNDLNIDRVAGGGNVKIEGSRILTTADEGSGNGIDADTLDGLHASSFLRDDATTTFNASGNDFNIDYDNVRTLVRIQRSGTEKLRLNASSNTITVNSYNSGELRWGVNLIPSSDNSVDLGSTSNRWRNLYTNDLHLSNESRKDTGGNDVDGTWGDWTLQEGEDKIFMINNRTGKRYSIIMREEN
jgi:hypothetical protein